MQIKTPEEIKTRVCIKGMGRKIEELDSCLCVLREESEPYRAVFCAQKERLSSDNSYFVDVLFAESIG